MGLFQYNTERISSLECSPKNCKHKILLHGLETAISKFEMKLAHACLRLMNSCISFIVFSIRFFLDNSILNAFVLTLLVMIVNYFYFFESQVNVFYIRCYHI